MKVQDYIGIPWLELGRDIKGCDCYGLVTIIYQQELGLSLPDFLPEETSKNVDEALRLTRIWRAQVLETGFPAVSLFDVVPIEQIKSMDVVWMRLVNPGGYITNHLGVYFGDGDLLETTAATGSILTRIEYRKNFIQKVFRRREV